ncbi:hypothetical protein [Kribbella catacumbae]|uniref:hypothetical protein n=1 Tax=Kribbella catacumbae TaxID=460086 RepID=UPI00036721A0|nr:hypothetical protein [Kribbella catacumbae]
MWLPVKYEFVVIPGCSVELLLTDDLPVLREALADCISTHPPWSTYWIDRAVKYLEYRLEDGGKEPLASGCCTYLQMRDGLVEARYEFGVEDDDLCDVVPAEELLTLLRAWREKVVEVSSGMRPKVSRQKALRRMPLL